MNTTRHKAIQMQSKQTLIITKETTSMMNKNNNKQQQKQKHKIRIEKEKKIKEFSA